MQDKQNVTLHFTYIKLTKTQRANSDSNLFYLNVQIIFSVRLQKIQINEYDNFFIIL